MSDFRLPNIKRNNLSYFSPKPLIWCRQNRLYYQCLCYRKLISRSFVKIMLTYSEWRVIWRLSYQSVTLFPISQNVVNFCFIPIPSTILFTLNISRKITSKLWFIFYFNGIELKSFLKFFFFSPKISIYLYVVS